MRKSYIIAIVLVAAVVLIAGLAWAQQDSEQEPATESQATNQESTEPEATESENAEAETNEGQTIVYDESGFSPSTLTVSQGDTVTFRNESTTPVWPASDNHPVHADLSGFDALESLEQGETYSYTFDETGEWGFHDHINPRYIGTITVQ